MSGDTAIAPAIPLERFIPSLVQYYLNSLDARLLERDEVFRTLQFRSHQIYYVHNYATSELNVFISISALTRALGCAYNRVKQTLAHGLEPLKSRGHHSALPPDIEQQILEWIEQNAAKRTIVTERDIRERFASRDKFAATRG
jgi:hypothetical protein